MDPKNRFSSRVNNYIKFRPTYPIDILNFLKQQKLLTKESIVADIGSGTGILSELILKNKNVVFCVEPNDNMRFAAEKFLKKYQNFKSIKGSAEQTNLKSNSIDLIVVGQAFHWFEMDETKKEFKRILKPGKNLAIIWNNRKKNISGFNEAYEKFILKYGIDYKKITKKHDNINSFFQHKKKSFYNHQDLDYEGLKGRLLSASYIPQQDDPNYTTMLREIKDLYDNYQENGLIKIEYDTIIYYGTLS